MASSVSQIKEEARRAEKREDWSRAIELYREALRLSEESGDISLDLSLYNRIGDLYRRRGDTDEAVRFYRKAVRQYAEEGLHTGAVALCNKILRLAPDHVDVYRVLGRLHASSGLAAEARNAFGEYADRMEERGDRSAAQDARLELARAVDDVEMMVEVLGRMASSGREAEARDALREVLEEHDGRGEPPDPRLEELSAEMEVSAAPAAEAEADAGDGDGEPDAAGGAADAAGPADAGADGERPPRGSPDHEGPDGDPAGGARGEEAVSGRDGVEPGPGDVEQDEEEEEDAEGVELEEILLHDPGGSAAAGEDREGADAEPPSPPEAAAEEAEEPGADDAPGDEALREPDREEPEARDDGRGGEPAPAPESSGGGETDEGVDLGERIRRRLGAGRAAVRDEAPDPGDFDDMLVGFRAQAAETSGKADPEAHVELGVALRQMGLLDDAVREFQIAARADDPPLRALELLGETFLEKDLHSVAVRVLNRALRLPGYSDHELLGVLYQLGVAYQSVDDHDGALDCFERVYSVDIDFRDVAERMESVRSDT